MKSRFILIISCSALIVSGQCSFQYISNDTAYQDYIEFIYPRKNEDKIIAIGSLITRGMINDSVFNCLNFQIFDYCGNISKNRIIKYVDRYKLKHLPIPTHNTFKEEPVGNTAIKINEDEFLIVDKAVDTLLKQSVLILYKINENGDLITYKTYNLNSNEANQTIVKNVLKLNDGKILVILWDYSYDYHFYYFDDKFNFLYTKFYNLGRGIRSIKEVGNQEFICTSLAYDNTSFQFYRLDTMGEVKWIVTPYNVFGSAREISIDNNRIYITGSTLSFGAFLIYDMDGNKLKEFKYDSFYCQARFCSSLVSPDNSFVIGGYIQHCQSSDSSGSDLAVIKIDSTGIIVWDKLYNFRNSLGTSGQQGKFTDFGGFAIAKANDGGIIINGMSRYNRLVAGGVAYEDALLVKTEPLIVSNIEYKNNIENTHFQVVGNLITNFIVIEGPIELIRNWIIYSSSGKVVCNGKGCSGYLDIRNIESGMFFLDLIDRKNKHYFFKFVKMY